MKKRQKEILDSLVILGGEASMRDIATETGLHVNGVSQSLGSMTLSPYVQRVPHERRWQGGDELYRIITDENQQPAYPPTAPSGQDTLF